MRLKLDDNERGAFNYLIGGTFIVLVLRALAWALDAFGPALTEDGALLRPFQCGYMGMRNKLATADAVMGLSGRVVLAVVLAVGAAAAVAFLLTAMGRLSGKRTTRAGALVTRAVLLASLAWGLFGAFFLPLKETRIVDGTMVVRQRAKLVGDLPLPFSLKVSRWSRADIAQITAVETAPVHGCDGSVVLWVNGTDQALKERIGGLAGICPENRMEPLRRASEASALLERELR